MDSYSPAVVSSTCPKLMSKASKGEQGTYAIASTPLVDICRDNFTKASLLVERSTLDGRFIQCAIRVFAGFLRKAAFAM